MDKAGNKQARIEWRQLEARVRAEITNEVDVQDGKQDSKNEVDKEVKKRVLVSFWENLPERRPS